MEVDVVMVVPCSSGKLGFLTLWIEDFNPYRVSRVAADGSGIVEVDALFNGDAVPEDVSDLVTEEDVIDLLNGVSGGVTVRNLIFSGNVPPDHLAARVYETLNTFLTSLSHFPQEFVRFTTGCLERGYIYGYDTQEISQSQASSTTGGGRNVMNILEELRDDADDYVCLLAAVTLEDFVSAAVDVHRDALHGICYATVSEMYPDKMQESFASLAGILRGRDRVYQDYLAGIAWAAADVVNQAVDVRTAFRPCQVTIPTIDTVPALVEELVAAMRRCGTFADLAEAL